MTPGGQNLYLTVLLPSNATVASVPIGNALNPMAWLEPSTYRLVIEDPNDPTQADHAGVLTFTY